MEMHGEQAKPPVDKLQTIADNGLCHACGQSGIGGRTENQDTYGGIADGDLVVLTVCDGMGGMAGGQTASNTAVREIIKQLTSSPTDQINANIVRRAVEQANEAIYRYAEQTPQLRGMGTTATVAVITPQALYLAHVGDSRIYLLRKGKKAFRTTDHSRVFEMVMQGVMTEEQARQSSFSNIITRALGARPFVEVDTHTLPYKKGDRLVLCSDGIWNTAPENDILDLLLTDGSVQEAVEHTTTFVNNAGYKNGCEHDNLTIIMAEMKSQSNFQYGVFHNIMESIASPFRKNK